MEICFIIFALIVAVANILTELAKQLISFKNDYQINGFVLAVSVILSLLSYCAFWSYSGYNFGFYVIAAFVIVGFLAAYAAMFGYDKLLKVITDALKSIKTEE